MSKLSFFAATLFLCLSFNSIASEKTDEVIAERIKPAGIVCVEGEDCGDANVVAANNSGNGETTGRSSEEVYNAHCMACHTTGAAGAPKLGDVAGWQSRIAKGQETLWDNALNGINAMPPRGACPSCTDDEIKAAVDFMVTKSQ